METGLHRELKMLYGTGSRSEVRVDGYRIDAVNRGRLIEIQQGSLGALRQKVSTLLNRHLVQVVKPIVYRKFITRHDRVGGPVLSERWGPRRGKFLDLFHDLVHFVPVFPHKKLRLELLLLEVSETRILTRRRPGYRVAERNLMTIVDRKLLKTEADLWSLLPNRDFRGGAFTTQEIAAACEIPLWHAQKIAYCFRRMGAIEIVGKRSRNVEYADRRAA